MNITTGRTVLYTLNESDANEINRRRTSRASIAERIQDGKWPLGAQAHIGNDVREGDVCPAVAIRVWSGDENPPVNLHVLLDGSDSYWATSRHEGTEPGTWAWPQISR